MAKFGFTNLLILDGFLPAPSSVTLRSPSVKRDSAFGFTFFCTSSSSQSLSPCAHYCFGILNALVAPSVYFFFRSGLGLQVSPPLSQLFLTGRTRIVLVLCRTSITVPSKKLPLRRPFFADSGSFSDFHYSSELNTVSGSPLANMAPALCCPTIWWSLAACTSSLRPRPPLLHGSLSSDPHFSSKTDWFLAETFYLLAQAPAICSVPLHGFLAQYPRVADLSSFPARVAIRPDRSRNLGFICASPSTDFTKIEKCTICGGESPCLVGRVLALPVWRMFPVVFSSCV